MGTKAICDRCEAEHTTSPVVASQLVAPGTAAPKWVKIRVNVAPMYVNQMTIDICPDCCTALGLPSDGRAAAQESRGAIEDIFRDIVQEMIEDYNT